MAERRMFSKSIIDSDAFLDMPMSARLLYYDLSMRADDDGFVNSPKKITRITGATQQDIDVLIANKFIIPFDDKGIVVIKHWFIHNYIRKDMYKETNYKEEKALLERDENNAYTLALNEVVTLPLQTCNEPVTAFRGDASTQVRLGKDSIGKDRVGKDRVGKDSIGQKEPKAPAAYYPDDEALNEAFKEFVKMRKTIKKPLTDNAIKRQMNKLDKLAGTDNDLAINILYQSIDHCWQDLYPLKEAKPAEKQGESCWDSLMRKLEEEDDQAGSFNFNS
jgi:hypothetical protein